MANPTRHQAQPEYSVVTSDGQRRLQLALEAEIAAAGAAGVTTFNGRFGFVTLLFADVIAALGYTPSAGGGSGWLPVSIEDLPLADPTKPLLRWLLTNGLTFVGGSADIDVAATGTPSIEIRKNGAANGSIDDTGVVTITNLVYAPGDVFELWPPATADATWDGVSVTFETT